MKTNKTIRTLNAALILCLLTLVAFPLALAGQEFDQTVPISAKGEVSIEMISGTLKFVAWDRAEVQVKGTLGDDVEEVEIDASGDSVEIEVEIRSGRDGSAHLTIFMPAGASLDVEVISANVTIEGIRGELEIEVVSGNIEISGASANVDIETISGKIELVGGVLEGGSFETVSGSILVDADLAAGGRFNFEAVSGKIKLKLPADVSAEFEVETFSGKIKNDFGPKAEKTSKWIPAQTLEFETGGGAAKVSVECFSGSIHLIRK